MPNDLSCNNRNVTTTILLFFLLVVWIVQYLLKGIIYTIDILFLGVFVIAEMYWYLKRAFLGCKLYSIRVSCGVDTEVLYLIGILCVHFWVDYVLVHTGQPSLNNPLLHNQYLLLGRLIWSPRCTNPFLYSCVPGMSWLNMLVIFSISARLGMFICDCSCATVQQYSCSVC